MELPDRWVTCASPALGGEVAKSFPEISMKGLAGVLIPTPGMLVRTG